MKFLSLFILIIAFSAQAEQCEGINACAILYTKLTGQQLVVDDSITDEMTLAAPNVNLTKENAKIEFQSFMNKNVVTINKLPKETRLVANRSGEFITSPIFIVSENNMPQLFSKEGLVTFVYHAKGDPEKLTAKTRGMLSRKMPKPHSMNKVMAFKESKIFVVSDTVEVAQKVMAQVFKVDK